MSGIENKHLMEQLGYDDVYRSDEDSRQLYDTLFRMNWEPGKFVSMRTSYIAVSAPHAHNATIAKACAQTLIVIDKARVSSKLAVERINKHSRVYQRAEPKEPPPLPPATDIWGNKL